MKGWSVPTCIQQKRPEAKEGRSGLPGPACRLPGPRGGRLPLGQPRPQLQVPAGAGGPPSGPCSVCRAQGPPGQAREARAQPYSHGGGASL